MTNSNNTVGLLYIEEVQKKRFCTLFKEWRTKIKENARVCYNYIILSKREMRISKNGRNRKIILKVTKSNILGQLLIQ